MSAPLVRFLSGLLAGTISGVLLAALVEQVPVAEPSAEVAVAASATAEDAVGAVQARAATPTPAPVPTTACVPAPLAERAGAVLVVGLPSVTAPDDPLVASVLAADVGGILLTKTNVVSQEQVGELVGELRATVGRSLLIATDEEPGRVSSFGELIGRSSSARTLASRMEPEEVRDFAADLGSDLAGYGVDLALAPVADLDDGPSQGVIGDRSFSVDPDEAATYARAFAHGLVDGGVLPAAKHFPGHGQSRVDSHRRAATVDVTIDELAHADLVPFAEQISAGVPVVMLGHVAYTPFDDELPASLAPGAYDLLRDMGFTGVAMTDSIGMGAVNLRWPFPEAAVMAVGAGADAVLATDGNHSLAMRDAIVAAVVAGRLSEARLDEAVARMQLLKGADPAELVCIDVAFPEPMRAGAAAGINRG